MKKLKAILNAVVKYGGWAVAVATMVLEKLDVINLFK